MSEIRLPWWVRTDRQMDRHIARSYTHKFPWSSWNTHLRGFCVRCAWRDVTGQTKRAKRAYVAAIRAQQERQS